MGVKSVLRRMESIRTRLDSEVERLQRLRNSIDACLAECDSINLGKSKSMSFSEEVGLQKSACDTLRKISYTQFTIMGELEGCSWSIDEAYDQIDRLSS